MHPTTTRAAALLLLALSPFATAQQGKESSRADLAATAIKKKAVKVLGEAVRAVDGIAHGAAWSPDGKSFAVGGQDGVTVFDAKTGQRRQQLEASGTITGLVYTVDGKELIGVGPKGLQAWTTKKGKPSAEASFDGDSDGTAPCRLAVHEATGLIACAGPASRRIELYTRKKLRHQQSLACDLGEIRDLAFGTDGKQLFVLGKEPHRLLAIDLESGEVTHSYDFEKWCHRVQVTPDGQSVVVSERNNLHFLAPADFSLQQRKRVIAEEIGAFAFSADGRRIYLGCQASSIACFDRDADELIWRHEQSTGQADSLALSGDGERLGVATHSFSTTAITFLSAADGKVALPTDGHQGMVDAVRFAAAGTQLLSGGDDGAAYAWNVANGKKTRTLPELPGGAATLQFAADGTLWAAARHGWIHQLMAPEWQVQHTLRVDQNHHYFSNAFFVSSDGKTAWSTHQGNDLLRWDLQARSIAETVRLPGGDSFQTMEVCVSPSGNTMAMGNDDLLHVFDTTTRQVLHSFQPHPGFGGLDYVALPDDENLITAGNMKGILHRWDARTGKATGELRLDDSQLYVLARNDDGSLLLTASNDTLFVVDAGKLALRRQSKAFTGSVRSLTADAAGRWVAAGMYDGRVLLFDRKKMK